MCTKILKRLFPRVPAESEKDLLREEGRADERFSESCSARIQSLEDFRFPNDLKKGAGTFDDLGKSQQNGGFVKALPPQAGLCAQKLRNEAP